jgi:hypothetical protein
MNKIRLLIISLFSLSIIDIITTFFALEYFNLRELNGTIIFLYNIHPLMIFVFPFWITLLYVFLALILIKMKLKIEANVTIILIVGLTFITIINNITWILNTIFFS